MDGCELRNECICLVSVNDDIELVASFTPDSALASTAIEFLHMAASTTASSPRAGLRSRFWTLACSLAGLARDDDSTSSRAAMVRPGLQILPPPRSRPEFALLRTSWTWMRMGRSWT